MNQHQIVQALRAEKKWLVSAKGVRIELSKVFNGKPVTVILERTRSLNGSKYNVTFPSYLFESSISYFAPTKGEQRLCRNKVLLASMIKVLKQSKIWKYIDEDFIQINNKNKKINKRKIQEELLRLGM